MIINKLYEYQDIIQDKCAIIDWDVYKRSTTCRFVLEEEEDVKILEDVIEKIKELENKVKIFVCTYPIDLTEEEVFVYSDTIWISTNFDKNELTNIFRAVRRIEPSDIIDIDQMEKDEVVLYIDDKLNGIDYVDIFNIIQIDKIKCLYWD